MKRTRTDFPRAVRLIDNAWIPLSDGVRLAARIWLPAEAEADPVPAVLEYIPYRKGDGTAVGDSTRHTYFAGHGYASVRVDMRGSGDSDGILLDEYLSQEQDDALEVIAWLASQPWCTGALGMMGISWGGFNSLQVAARRPPALKAIITVCSTDDRYADDVHYIGGCLLGIEMLSWASTMLAFNARPPDPAVVGERWREMWLERLEKTPPFVEAWLSHQRRDAYWKHGSVCEDYAAIECPVYAVGGWADAYTNAVLRLLAGLSCPRKGLIGPWSHNYPEEGIPGPAIGFLQEALRWWDHWLKGIDTGVMAEPMLRVWMQEWVEPRPFYAERPGRWIAEREWPSRRIDPHSTHLAFPADRVLGAQECGLLAGDWCPYGNPEELPGDQRPEDGASICFDSEPIPERVEILGAPEVRLELAADRPQALVAVRLCDVTPEGSVLLVSRALLNLTHRDGHGEPVALEPGRRFGVAISLKVVAHAFPAGHRIRVAVSPTYWPWAWPSPEAVTLSLFGGELVLPVRPPDLEDEGLAASAPPEGAPPLAVDVLRARDWGSTLRHDIASGCFELAFRQDYWGRRRIVESGIEFETFGADVFTIVAGEPLSARTGSDRTVSMSRGDWQIRVETSSTLSADAETFYLTNHVEAFEGNVRVFVQARHAELPRDHV
jgi:putative CocE/NonD family hydrolase